MLDGNICGMFENGFGLRDIEEPRFGKALRDVSSPPQRLIVQFFSPFFAFLKEHNFVYISRLWSKYIAYPYAVSQYIFSAVHVTVSM